MDWKELFEHPIFFHTGEATHQNIFSDEIKDIIKDI